MYTRILRTLRTHHIAVAMGLLVAGIAVLLQLPLPTPSMPQNMPTAVGAAAAAVFAVSGAGWLANHRERHSKLEVLRVLMAATTPALRYARTVEVFLECAIRLQASHADREEVLSTVRFAQKESRKLIVVTRAMDDRLLAMQPLFLQFGRVGVIACGTLVRAGERLRDNVERVPWQDLLDCPESLDIDLAQLREQNHDVFDQVRSALTMLQHFTAYDPGGPAAR